MKILTHEGLQYFYNQIAAKFSTKKQTAEAIEEAVSNVTAGAVTSVNGKTGTVELSASDVGALPVSTTIPDALSDLTSDATHRTVTDAEKVAWNAKSDFSGSYNDLTNKPTIPSISGLATETYVDEKIAAIEMPTPDWNANEGEPGYIANRTHYDGLGWGTEVIPTTVIPFTMPSDDEYWYVVDTASTMAEPIDQQTYKVIFNGDEYICVCKDNGLGYYYNDGQAPFSFYWDSEGFIFVSTKEQFPEITLSVLAPVTVRHKLSLDWIDTTGLATETYVNEALGNAGVGTVTSVNGKTGVVQLSASDVGALPASTQIPSIAGLATETYVDNKVASMVDSAPETLNTLNELAAALGDDPNFATTVATEIGGKVNKSGDTMTGNLTIKKSTYPTIRLTEDDTNKALNLQFASGIFDVSAFNAGDSADNYRTVRLCDSSYRSNVSDALALLDTVNGTRNTYKIYHEGNKPTAADVGALPISGGTLTGSLTMGTGTLFTTGHMNIGSSTGPYLYTGGTNFVVRYGNSSNYHYANFTEGGPVEIDGVAVSLTGHTHTPAEIGAVSKTGDTMTGNLTASSLSIKSDGWAMLRFYNTEGAETGGFYSNQDARQLNFFSKDKSGYNDYFKLPYPSGLTADGYYDILTSKNPVTIAQGGTGATTAQDAAHSLIRGNAIAPANIEFWPASDTATHGGYIDFHFNQASDDYTSRIIEGAKGVLDINILGDVRVGNITYGNWKGSAIPVANGGTGATDAATARTNLGITPANIGAAAASHTHNGSDIQGQVALADTAKYLGSEDMKLSLSSFGGHTGLLALKGGKHDYLLYHWDEGDIPALAVHYYNNEGEWLANNVLLNHQNFYNWVTPAAIGAFGALGNAGDFGSDLNNFTQQGAVLVSGEVANRPSGTGVYGICWNVFGKANTYLEQHYVDAATLKRYVRFKIDNVWRAWAQEYDSNFKPTLAEIGAAPTSHTHNFITDGNASVFIGVATTPILSVRKGSYNHWGIERVGDSDNRLKWHYYDPSTGSWQGNAILIDSNGGTINGAVTINNTLTATKVIGAVYA